MGNECWNSIPLVSVASGHMATGSDRNGPRYSVSSPSGWCLVSFRLICNPFKRKFLTNRLNDVFRSDASIPTGQRRWPHQLMSHCFSSSSSGCGDDVIVVWSPSSSSPVSPINFLAVTNQSHSAEFVIWGPIYKISYDNLTIILRSCQSYDQLTTDVLFTKHLTMNGKLFMGKIHVQNRNIVEDSVVN